MPKGQKLINYIITGQSSVAYKDLEDAIERVPTKPVAITFTDTMGMEPGDEPREEEGVDGGGLSREFFTLGLCNIRDSKLFVGSSEEKALNYHGPGNVTRQGENDYELAGMFMAMALIQGAAGPNFLTTELYDALLTGSINKVKEHSLDPVVRRHQVRILKFR